MFLRCCVVVFCSLRRRCHGRRPPASPPPQLQQLQWPRHHEFDVHHFGMRFTGVMAEKVFQDLGIARRVLWMEGVSVVLHHSFLGGVDI